MGRTVFPFPLPLLLIDLFGVVLLVLGVLGLTGGLASLPVLARPLVAWSMVGVGGATVVAAGLLIALHLSRRARGDA